jgi:hypothetical protein
MVEALGAEDLDEAALKNHDLRTPQRRRAHALAVAVVFALVDVPYAVVRRHLIQGEPPPPLAAELVTETLRCVLIGDG